MPTAVVKTATLDERDHERDCPATRVESYSERKPNGNTVLITRCLDCGGHRAEEARR